MASGEAPDGTFAVAIKRPDYGAALEAKIQGDRTIAIAEYSALKNTDGGRILNTDEARELSPDYREDRTRWADVHEPASQFVKDPYAEKLKQPVAEGRKPLVLFTAGATGAGKSAALRTTEGAALNAQADIIYDTNMNSVPSAEKKIQQALDSGRDIHIQYTYRDPVEALTRGALPRAMKMGRTVPLDDHINTHVGSRETMDVLQAKYADDPRVSFTGYDNTRGVGQATDKPIDSLPAVEENGLRERLENALNEEHRAGRISDAVRNATAGAELRREKAGAGADRQPEPQRDRERSGTREADRLDPRDLPTVPTPGELKPYDVARVPLDQRHVDPKRFQDKMSTDASGVTNLLKGASLERRPRRRGERVARPAGRQELRRERPTRSCLSLGCAGPRKAPSVVCW